MKTQNKISDTSLDDNDSLTAILLVLAIYLASLVLIVQMAVSD
jgi:hypothetical protein